MKYNIVLNSSIGTYYVPEKEFPGGWEDFTLIISRHKTLHGLFPNVDSNLDFYDNAAKFILDTYEVEKLNLKVYVYITIDLPNQTPYLICDGLIDIKTITIKPFTNNNVKQYLVSCNIKSNNCTQLFLDRVDSDFNIFLNQAYDIYTMDNTALHTRYTFAPYPVYFPVVPLPTTAEVMLDAGCKNGVTDSGLLAFCETPLFTTITDCTPFNQNYNPDFPTVYVWGLPYNSFNQMLGEPPFYVNSFKAVEQCVNPPLKYIKVLDNNKVDRHSFADWVSQQNASFPTYHHFGNLMTDSVYNSCPDGTSFYQASCSCAEYIITLDIEFDYGFYETRSVLNPQLLWKMLSAEVSIEVRFGAYSQTIVVNPAIAFPYPPNILASNIFTMGTYANNFNNLSAPYNQPNSAFRVNLNPLDCETFIGAELEIWVRFTTFAELYNPLLLYNISKATGFANYKKFDVTVTEICKNVIGATDEYCMPVHEGLSRLVEHYTNNCLRVKTCFFGREDSLAGGDDLSLQHSIDCATQLPRPLPTDVPSNTITDLYKFQTGLNVGNVCIEEGCGSVFVFTQGITLRRMGREIFTNFKDLFASLDGIWNIGAGYSTKDPNVIRVEAKEYFYNNEIILTLNIDEIENDFTLKIDDGAVYKNISCGYKELKNERVKFIDAFNTPRSYNLQQKANNSTLNISSNFITDGATIEVQRTQIDEAEGPFDDQLIGVCVGVGKGSATDFTTPTKYRVETGITNPAISPTSTNPMLTLLWQIIGTDKIYNFRIAPYFNTLRWLSYIKMSFYGAQTQVLKFAKGYLNYFIGGREKDASPCNQDLGATPHFENDSIDLSTIETPRFGTQTGRKGLTSPEVVEFNYALTLEEFRLIEQNPEGTIVVNNIPYYIQRINFKLNDISKLTLIKHDISI